MIELDDRKPIPDATAEHAARVAALPTCPCGGADVRDLGPCRPYTNWSLSETERLIARDVHAGRLYECDTCRLQFRSPCISREQAARIYAAMPADTWQYDAAENGAWRLALRLLARRRPGALLDIGSFDGQFLRRVPTAWKRFAVEPNADACAALRCAGIEAVQASIAPGTIPDWEGRFDVVTMFDVFEHLHDPAAVIDYAITLVRPGGSLILSTGNCAHWTWKRLHGDHPYLVSPQHIVFGSPNYFRQLGLSRGWRPPRLQSFARNAAGLGQRLREAYEAVYFSERMRWKGRSPIVIAAHALPGTRGWLNRERMSHIQAVADHIFVEVYAEPRQKGSIGHD